MKGLELIKKAMAMQPVDRIPWVPFVGCHAGQLLGLTAEQFLQSKEHLVNGVNKTIELYNPDGIPVAFDLQIEAEALGCKIAWADDNPPAVVSHPLNEGVDLEDIVIPSKDEARIPIVLEATRQLRAQHPDLALYGLITGPFTLALHLLGTDIFLQMMMDPEATHKLMRVTTDIAIAMADYYMEAGVDVVALVDPMTSQIDPMSFETFVSPYVTEINNSIRAAGKLCSFFVCGNAKQNIEAMCQTKPDNISIDENIPLDFVRDMAMKYNVSFGGNMKLTVVLLMGDEDASRRDALECMDIGGKKGFILAPGCDLAMATPKENLIAVAELVHDEVLQGELRASDVVTKEVELLDLTDHWQEKQVVVDVVTLNSKACAACQYMLQAAEVASAPYGSKVICREYNILTPEGVQMMASLGVKNLPTIVIDGTIEFISQIPPINKIQEKIEAQLTAKGV
ncbi:uroporphyrinogen decarboxylase family protein [Mangrovibacterium sp.]|uniref:uroporphyrinogen decarboxylase family protein n=1 Tax=Mangrovibacterium sp. TaxID=1961364 RepID=UPI0035626057